MKQNEIKEVLRLHKLWVSSDPKGQRAILTGAILTGADLSGANLEDAILGRADLRSANLWNVNLRSANLEDAILSDASLFGANLGRADLRYATLTGAILTGADLSGAILTGAILTGATFDKKTKFPEGFNPIAYGMILVGEKASPSPVAQEVVAAVPAATSSTLHEDLSVVLAKHGLVLGKNVTLNINFID